MITENKESWESDSSTYSARFRNRDFLSGS